MSRTGSAGYTQLEVLVAALLLGFFLLWIHGLQGTVLLVGDRAGREATAQTEVNVAAVRIVRLIREAASVTISPSGTSLTLDIPGQGTVRVYLSGAEVVLQEGGRTTTLLANVASLTFAAASSGLVTLTIGADPGPDQVVLTTAAYPRLLTGMVPG